MNKTFLNIISCLVFILPTICLSQKSSPLQIKEAYTKHIGLEEGVPGNQVYDSFQDEYGYMWFTTDRGIVRYDGTQLKIFTVNDGLSNDVNFYFYKDSSKGFWVNDLGGQISYWNGEVFQTFKYKTPITSTNTNKNMSLIINISDTTITLVEGVKRSYIPKYNEIISINRQTGQTRTFSSETYTGTFNANNAETNFYLSLKNGKNLNTLLPNCHSLNIDEFAFMDSNLNIWQPRKDGAYLWKHLHYDKQPIVFFKGEHITSIIQDRDGGYWVTSLNNKIYYMPSIDVKAYRNNTTSLSSFVHGMTASENNLYISSYHGKFSVIDSLLNMNVYPCKDGTQPIYSSGVKEAHLRYYKYSEQSKTYQKKNVHKNSHALLSVKNSIIDFKINGLKLLKPNFSKGEYLDSLQSHRILCVMTDKQSNIYIGTRRTLIKTKILDEHKFQSPKVLLDYRINDIQPIQDGSGVFVATMNHGVFCAKDDQIIFLKGSKLNHETLQAVYQESDSIIWIGSNQGLFRASISLNEFRIDKLVKFTVQDGLISNNINRIIGWNNEIWVATDRGVCSFNPKTIKPDEGSPNIHIELIQQGYDTIADIHTTLTLDHSKNDLQIRYQGIEFDKPLYNKPFYRYKLNHLNERSEDPWIYTNSNISYFSNLSSGQYLFTVQCRSENDIWSKPATFKFIIAEPYYRTTLFYILVFITILILGAFISYYVQRYKTKRLKEKIKLREAQLSVLTNQMNPHFIFNTLNSIQSYIVTNNSDKASEYLSRLAKLMRKGLMFSKEQFITLEDEITFIENYTTLQNNRLNYSINYSIKTTGIDDLKDIYIPSLITQPIVENAILHAFNASHPSPQIKIYYHVHQPKGIIHVIIEDNGIGIQSKSKSSHQSYGMQIVKERLNILSKNTIIEDFEYSLSLEQASSNSKYPGTKISFWMPIKYNSM